MKKVPRTWAELDRDTKKYARSARHVVSSIRDALEMAYRDGYRTALADHKVRTRISPATRDE